MTTDADIKVKDRSLQAEAIRIVKAQQDFAFYCEYVHERPLFAHQKVWAEELQREGARTLIVAPPGSLKSTTVSYFIEWCIGRDPDFTCLYLMNTAEQARSKVSSIADTIETNPQYRLVFPQVTPDKPRGWSHDRLFVHRTNTNNPDATVYGTGFDGPYQGVHIHQIFIDDPTDQQDVYSTATMSQQRQRVKGVILDRLLPGGSIVAILTRWGINDLTKDLQEIGLKLIENPIVGDYPWGDLLCPEMFSYEDLGELERVKGPGLYAMTYLCNPAIFAAETLYFDAAALTAMLKTQVQEPIDTTLGGLVRIWKPPTSRGKYIAFGDVAWGEKGAYSCIPIVDYQTGEQVAEIYGRPDLSELAQVAVNLLTSYNRAFVGIEANGEGQSVVNKMVALGYGSRMYYRTPADGREQQGASPSLKKVAGWVTTGTQGGAGGTRPLMLEELAEAIRDQAIVVRCKDAMGELISFIRNDKGRPEAMEGTYDDHVMAWAGLWQMRKYAHFVTHGRGAKLQSAARGSQQR